MRSLMTSSATKTKKQIAHISSVLHGRSAALNHYSYGRYYAPTEGESFAIPAWVRAALAIVQDLQQNVEDIWMRLLDFIKQNNRVRLSSHRFS